MFPVSIEHYNDIERRNAQRALEALDRLDNRLEVHYNQIRKHQRRTFRGTAVVREIVTEPGLVPHSFTVLTRSLSASGMSFICPAVLEEKELLFGLELQPGQQIWLKGQIVRSREVPNERFWEYGVKFCDRVDAPR